MGYVAANTLIGNCETSLGAGAHISLYRGLVDTGFQLIAHDLDTILGRGDTAPIPSDNVFRAANVTATSSLTVSKGYPRTASSGIAAGTITGTAEAINTRSILANGQPAS